MFYYAYMKHKSLWLFYDNLLRLFELEDDSFSRPRTFAELF
jgi:hypothetical protein